MAFQFPLPDRVLDPGLTMHHELVEPTSCNWLKVEAALHMVENQTLVGVKYTGGLTRRWIGQMAVNVTRIIL